MARKIKKTSAGLRRDKHTKSVGSKNSSNLAKSAAVHEGKVICFASGTGIVEDKQNKQEFKLLAKDLSQVLDRDLVEFVVQPRRGRDGRKLASIKRVISRPRQRILARCATGADGLLYAQPLSSKLPRKISLISEFPDLAADVLVVVKLVTAEDLTLLPQLQGEVVEIVPDAAAGPLDYEIKSALLEYGLREKFPAEVVAAAAACSPKVKAAAKATKRISLQHLSFVTIDGEDAKDFDDAVYCQEEKSGWRLWVAIADVAHYVVPGSPLDREAQLRTASVYFPQRVLPMLPATLSDDLCSLRPDKPRLAMVCEMQLDRHGNLREKQFYEALINSKRRLTYEEVEEFIAKGYRRRGIFRGTVGSSLAALHKLTQLLLQRREQRDSLNLKHVSEVRVDFAKDGSVANLYVYKRNRAHLMIEEAMLLTNVCASQFITAHKLPFCNRVHEQPAQKKLDELRLLLAPYKIKVPAHSPTNQDYCQILAQVHTLPEAEVLEMLVLRSLPQAVYSTKNNGHFGLNYEQYTHFTSPIRRYPDLLNHRAIKSILRQDPQLYPYTSNQVASLAKNCSEMERSINKSVWQVLDVLKCYYLQGVAQLEYQGMITFIHDGGIYVRLAQLPLEGMVRLRSLQRKYSYASWDKKLYERSSGRSLSIGSAVKVRVNNISLNERKIELSLL